MTTQLGTIAKEDAKALLVKLGDAIDGQPDGSFSVSDLLGRVQREAQRVATLPERAAAHPMTYLWGGVAAGVIIGIIVSPIAQGVAGLVARFIGVK